MYENNVKTPLPKLLYIMGTARSGSTVLEIMLAANPDVFGGGELTSLVQDGFLENKDCSCGRPCHSCGVWRKVIATLDMNEESLREWSALQKKIDWHDGFFRQLLGLVSHSDKRRYQEWNTKFLKTTQAVTGASVILDSSKYAGRALALSKIVQADVMVICLTRSPAGLMASFQKPNKDEQRPKGLFAAMLYYLVTLVSLRIASVLLGRRVYPVRYESLLANPESTLRDIEAWSCIDLTKALQQLRAKEAFPIGHLVTGNRLRKQGEIRFEPELGDTMYIGLGAKAAVTVMNGCRWLLKF
jgi:hypothetical protein